MRLDNRSVKFRTNVAVVLAVLVILAFFALVLADEEGMARRKLGFWDILSFPRYWMSAIFAAIGFVLLAKARFTNGLRLAFLPVIFFVFSVISVLPLGNFARGMGLHPSPLCATTKPFLLLDMGRTVPIVFLVTLLVVAVLTIVGNKLFCGWVCPIGALQELVHRIPLPKRLKAKVPFKVANTVRIVVFVAFVIVAFATGMEIYEYVNPFEFLHWQFDLIGIAIISGTIVVSLFLWRPFCYFLCPLGLLTWILEHASLVRIKVDSDTCTHCNQCIEDAPCLAMSSIVEGKRARPDCFACGLCLDLCEEKSISFRV